MLVEVGPRLCDNPTVREAFNQFQSSVHRPVQGSPGPESGAPGLQDHNDPNITVCPCSFVAP